jgi:outer membrane lipoprotein-sorting protein
MHLEMKLIFAVSIALILAPARAAFAAPPPTPNDLDKQKVLRRLDIAAATFHNTCADFQFDTEQIDPVPDTDIQKGTVYYQRAGAAFKMAAHISEANKKPVTRVYTYSGGLLTFFDKSANQVTRFSKAGQFESYLELGFGASGKELEEKWEITYLGSEIIDGVKTEKLELVAKDPEVRKNLAKVTIWIDPERAVSLRQRFDQNRSTYRICTYTRFRINQPSLPADAFTFKTDAQTQYSNR